MLNSNVEGQLLIAMPGMSDARFARSVVLVCAHSDEGAMGLIINQPAGDLTFGQLIEQIDLFGDGAVIEIDAAVAARPTHNGGPVESSRGFVLHSPDYTADQATTKVSDGICLTQTIDVLKAIAAGKGPREHILALGCAGWAPGQLEWELGANGWLTCPADPRLVFEVAPEEKYARALAKLGVDPSRLVSEAGRA